MAEAECIKPKNRIKKGEGFCPSPFFCLDSFDQNPEKLKKNIDKTRFIVYTFVFTKSPDYRFAASISIVRL